MKFNFKKISAIASSALMVSMTAGFAMAASFPAPFQGSAATSVAVVSGSGAGVDDTVAANSIANYLAGKVASTGGASTTSGGDSILLSKSSNNLNIGNNITIFTGSIDEDDLSSLLADGTYSADDNDEFDYEQKIELNAQMPLLTHFRDSDYEDLAGLDSRTPTVGFKLGSNTKVLAYTLDFTTDAESDIVIGDMDDIEGSDLMLMGKSYYVSDLKNGTSTSTFGKLTLLDSANIASVGEGETVSVTSGGNSYDVGITYIDSDEVTFIVNGELAPKSGKLQKGESYKLSDGAYIGARDISKLEVSGETGSASFSIGSGKLEITSGSDVKLNDDSIQGVKGYVYKGTGSGNTEKIDKIQINWTTDEEMFLAPGFDLLMPGFEAVKLTMNELVRPAEEKITIDKDSDTSIEMSLPIKDGKVSFNLLYSNASGSFAGIGKAADERLSTSASTTLYFQEKDGSGDDYDSWFVATYNITQEAQSYLLRAKIVYDSSSDRNETTIQKNIGGSWTDACTDKTASQTCDIGDLTLTISAIEYTSGGGENVTLTAGTDVNFHSIVTEGGLRIYLPYSSTNTTTATADGNYGAINLGDEFAGNSSAGHSADTFYLYMDGEDKDENQAAGTMFNVTLDDNSDKLHVSQVAHAGTGGTDGEEVGDSTSVYETYIVDDVAPRILHYTNPDEDWVEVFYPGTDNSETYAEVYLAESDVTVSAGGVVAGSLVFKDSEKASWQSRDVVLVGGSCINSATAEALGVSSGTCGSAFTSSTGVGAGQYLIQSVGDAFSTGNVAVVVAGYNKDDTAAAANRLVNQPGTIDTTAGNKYLGVVGVTGTSTISQVE